LVSLLMRGFLFLPNDKKSPADLTKNPLGFSFKTCWILDYNVNFEFIAQFFKTYKTIFNLSTDNI